MSKIALEKLEDYEFSTSPHDTNIHDLLRDDKKDEWERFLLLRSFHYKIQDILQDIRENFIFYPSNYYSDFCTFWLQNFPEDFSLQEDKDAVINLLVENFSASPLNVYKLINPDQKTDFLLPQISASAPKTSSIEGEEGFLSSLSDSILAEHITSKVYSLFTKISYLEIIDYHLNPSFPSSKIQEFLNFEKKIYSFFTNLILRKETSDDRATSISKIINIMKELRSLRNWNTLGTLISVLSSPYISRLYISWSKVPKNLTKKLETFHTLYSPSENFINLRTKLEKKMSKSFYYKTPSIPYLSLIMTSLDGFTSSGQCIILKNFRYQQQKRNFYKTSNIDPTILSYLSRLKPYSEEDDEKWWKTSILYESNKSNVSETYETFAQDLLEGIEKELSETKSAKKTIILLGGGSGAGKSSLIRAIFNVDIKSEAGLPQTSSITKYDLPKQPVTIYDVPGVEFGDVSKYEKEIFDFLSNDSRKIHLKEKVHCIWYVISGATSRIFPQELELIKKLYCQVDINNKPKYSLFIILSKVDLITESDKLKMMKIIEEHFKDSPSYKGTFPIVAERNPGSINMPSIVSQAPKHHHFKCRQKTEGTVFTFYSKSDKVIKRILIGNQEGLEPLIEKTTNTLDTVMKNIFIASQFASIRTKDEKAREILNLYIDLAQFETYPLETLLEMLTKDLMKIWFVGNKYFREKKTPGIKAKLLSILNNTIIPGKLKEISEIVKTGVSIHNYLRSCVALSIDETPTTPRRRSSFKSKASQSFTQLPDPYSLLSSSPPAESHIGSYDQKRKSICSNSSFNSRLTDSSERLDRLIDLESISSSSGHDHDLMNSHENDDDFIFEYMPRSSSENNVLKNRANSCSQLKAYVSELWKEDTMEELTLASRKEKYLVKIDKALFSGKYEDVIKYYTELLETDSKDFDSYNGRAMAYLLLPFSSENLRKASQDVAVMSNIENTRYEVYEKTGQICSKNGDFSGALLAFDTAYKLLYMRKVPSEKIKDKEKVLSELEEAIFDTKSSLENLRRKNSSF